MRHVSALCMIRFVFSFAPMGQTSYRQHGVDLALAERLSITLTGGTLTIRPLAELWHVQIRGQWSVPSPLEAHTRSPTNGSIARTHGPASFASAVALPLSSRKPEGVRNSRVSTAYNVVCAIGDPSGVWQRHVAPPQNTQTSRRNEGSANVQADDRIVMSRCWKLFSHIMANHRLELCGSVIFVRGGTRAHVGAPWSNVAVGTMRQMDPTRKGEQMLD